MSKFRFKIGDWVKINKEFGDFKVVGVNGAFMVSVIEKNHMDITTKGRIMDISKLRKIDCPTCGGTKEINTDVEDGEGHLEKGVGTEVCPDCK